MDSADREGSEKARILVVDDHDLVRSGIINLLQGEDWIVCGEAGNGKEAIEKCLALHPDLVLMDISMPKVNGLEATKEIRQLMPSAKIIILSMHDSPQIEVQMKKAGANAYLTKTTTPEKLKETIRRVLDNHGGSN
jgi:DNA-binding NarL/FixJ family response regulator